MIRRRRKDDGEDVDVEAQAKEEDSTKEAGTAAALAGRRGRKRRWCQWLRKRICSFSLGFLCVTLLILMVHELCYFVVLNRIAIHPKRRARRDVPLHQAKVAVVSLHRGLKFSGYLGKWLSDRKAAYAEHHGYAYVDETLLPPEHKLVPLNKWQQVYRRRIKFDKLRFLLFLMESYPNLRYLLWLDADAVITEPDIRVQARVALFSELFNARNPDATTDFCFVWAADSRPNTGILLLVNTPVTRSLLKTSLTTFSEKQIFIDQASFTTTVEANETYTKCQLILENERSVLLQSRVRGRPSQQWKLGHWIMHLPNHNRLEMIQALSNWLPHYGEEGIPCQFLSPIDPPDLSSLSKERRSRYEAVREAIRHAWGGYTSAVLRGGEHSPAGTIPPDDLSPLSHAAHSWLYYAATLHDSVDTLYLANLTVEYNEAVSFLTSYDIQTTSLRPTKTFEYSLRVLGGLLGAYSLSGDTRLLLAARNAADAMIDGPFASSPTALPRMYDVLAPPTSSSWKATLHRLYARIYQWGRDAFTEEHRTNSLAGIGSFGVEFSFLTRITRDWAYRDAANAIFERVTATHNDTAARQRLENGVVPAFWNVMTGAPLNHGGGLGSGADSFYEYLLKTPLLNGCTKRNGGASGCTESDNAMLLLYQEMVNISLRSSHVLAAKVPPKEIVSYAYPVDNSAFHHLLCFVPGMLALGAVELSRKLNEDDMSLARSLLMGCHDAYSRTPSGLAPEKARIRRSSNPGRREDDTNPASDYYASDRSYLLRPEYVESLFMLHRLTREESYQEMAWEVFQSLNKYCKVDGGFAGLQDVYNPKKGHVDDMPSYFIAETLKYLLLLFGPDDYVSLDDYVFTTEAHPIRRIHNDNIRICNTDSESMMPVGVPWVLVGAVVSIVIAIGIVVGGALWLWSRCPIRGISKRKDA